MKSFCLIIGYVIKLEHSKVIILKFKGISLARLCITVHELIKRAASKHSEIKKTGICTSMNANIWIVLNLIGH